MKKTMPAVLIPSESKRRGFIVGIPILRRAEQGGPGIDQQMEVALEADGAAEIGARRHAYSAAAGRC